MKGGNDFRLVTLDAELANAAIRAGVAIFGKP